MTPEYPIPRLPQPLTEDGLRNLMRERAYWDLKNPRSSLYQRLVAQGFAMLYPGTAKYDETGKAVDVPPLPPEAVAHRVAQVNREMDRLERSLEGSSFVARDRRAEEAAEGEFDERQSGGGDDTVHVQAHTRDGGKTEVVDYWRASPGQGGRTDANNGSGNADDAEGIQTGTDDQRLPPRDAHVAPDVDRLAREWSGTWQGESKECVALVKKAIPGIGATPTWQEGEKLKGPGDPPLEPGTPIATFEDGKYPNRSTGNHAAIVIEPGVKDGKEGYWVLDQSRENPANRRFIAFNSPSRLFTSQLENYSVIRKGP